MISRIFRICKFYWFPKTSIFSSRCCNLYIHRRISLSFASSVMLCYGEDVTLYLAYLQVCCKFALKVFSSKTMITIYAVCI